MDDGALQSAELWIQREGQTSTRHDSTQDSLRLQAFVEKVAVLRGALGESSRPIEYGSSALSQAQAPPVLCASVAVDRGGGQWRTVRASGPRRGANW